MDETLFVEVPGGRVWVHRLGGGAGFPLVMLHGGPGSPHDYLQPLSVLEDQREVVFFDQLGCGRSDRPDDEALWVLDRFLGELDEVLGVLGRGPCHLLGHSWGAMLAVDYALAHPTRVKSLILSSPCLSMQRVRDDMQRLRTLLPEALRRTIERCETNDETESGAYGAAAMAFYRRHVCRMPEWPEPLIRSQSGWNQQIYRTMWGPAEFHPIGNLADYEREHRLAEIRCPVLYLCGAHDEMTPESTSAFHAATPNAELTIFADSAHVPHLEEPEAYLETVRDFLTRADSP